MAGGAGVCSGLWPSGGWASERRLWPLSFDLAATAREECEWAGLQYKPKQAQETFGRSSSSRLDASPQKQEHRRPGIGDRAADSPEEEGVGVGVPGG